MPHEITHSTLLAYRDGEPLPADLRAQIEQDPKLLARVDQYRRWQSQLQALPELEPATDQWDQLQQRMAARGSRHTGWQQSGWRGATAAAVFGVALIASVLWLRDDAAQPWLPVASVTVTDPVSSESLTHLVGRSRQLEAAVQRQVQVAGTGSSSSQRALLFRIADLDAELNSMQQESMGPQLKERLWRQRVELLETLMEIQRYQMHEQADL